VDLGVAIDARAQRSELVSGVLQHALHPFDLPGLAVQRMDSLLRQEPVGLRLENEIDEEIVRGPIRGWGELPLEVRGREVAHGCASSSP